MHLCQSFLKHRSHERGKGVGEKTASGVQQDSLREVIFTRACLNCKLNAEWDLRICRICLSPIGYGMKLSAAQFSLYVYNVHRCWRCLMPSLGPIASIKVTIADGFGEMLRFYGVALFEIGDGSRHFQYAIICSCRQT